MIFIKAPKSMQHLRITYAFLPPIEYWVFQTVGGLFAGKKEVNFLKILRFFINLKVNQNRF